MKIEKNKVVSVTYDLYSSTGESGERMHVESTGNDEPLIFLFGSGNLIPDFEDNLMGMAKGEAFEFSIDAENAYGIVDKAAFVQIPVDVFKVDGIIDFSMLKTGHVIPLSDKQGNRMDAKVVKLEGDNVLMDFNHPLAGHDLHFAGKVVEVREATVDEITHGHAHTGKDGH